MRRDVATARLGENVVESLMPLVAHQCPLREADQFSAREPIVDGHDQPAVKTFIDSIQPVESLCLYLAQRALFQIAQCISLGSRHRWTIAPPEAFPIERHSLFNNGFTPSRNHIHRYSVE